MRQQDKLQGKGKASKITSKKCNKQKNVIDKENKN